MRTARRDEITLKEDIMYCRDVLGENNSSGSSYCPFFYLLLSVSLLIIITRTHTLDLTLQWAGIEKKTIDICLRCCDFHLLEVLRFSFARNLH